MWDPIMQVGKTPQITSDANLNPYSISQDDISQLFYIFLSQTGTGSTATGSALNLTNTYYDYTVTPALRINQSGTGGTDTIVTADCGKVLNVRGISLMIQHNHMSVDRDATIYIEGTEDGINWIQYISYPIPDVLTDTQDTLSMSDKRFKTMRIRIAYSGALGGAFYLDLNKLRIWVDSKQYFY